MKISWDEGVVFEVKYIAWEYDNQEMTFLFTDLRSAIATVSDVVTAIEAVLQGKDNEIRGHVKEIRELPHSGIVLTYVED